MTTLRRHAATLAALLLAAEPALAAPRSLFDGTSLQGWSQPTGWASYSAEDGAIVGRTPPGISHVSSFLCTDERFGDFELTLKVKIDDNFNSGVQIRTQTAANLPHGLVFGPQVEVATNGTAGNIYGEGLGVTWFGQKIDDPVKAAAFRRGEWNDYRVRTEGQRIRTWVNGTPIADMTDDVTGLTEGRICLQVHAVIPGFMPAPEAGPGPWEVRYKDIHIDTSP
ncbi:MAG: DUF1080 domain-containing protein [Alphaproteobacteria bacterium]|nr:DUF1080 domain-containing protein [Alphaproteobacteria bacterium]